MIRFISPWWLLLLVIPVVQTVWYLQKENRMHGALRHPQTGIMKRIRPSMWARMRHVVFAVHVLAEVILIVALARPQAGRILQRVTSEGIEIVLALDVSGSMKAFDLGDRERIDVAKDFTRRFIDERRTDRIGLVVFAGESYLQCPLTIDYGILRTLLDNVSPTMDGTIPDGTAIGMAIAMATNRLRRSPAESRIMILLTDGANNAGIIDPLTAAAAAKQVGVRIHTVGVGVQERAPVRVRDPFYGDRVEFIDDSLDEDILKSVARKTGGEFFRATSESAMVEIFNEISRMEQTEIETIQIPRYTELTFTYRLILFGLALLFLQFVLSQTLFRTVP